MAAVLRFAGLLRSSLRSGGHFRSVSALAVRTLPKDDDYCYIIGRHGDLRLPSKGIMELCDYFKQVPLFDRATVGRLIQEVPKDYPHLASGKLRDCLRTGIIPLYLAKLRGYSLSPADYKEDNLGIHPPTGTIVFRSATMTPYEGEGNCYKPFLSLLTTLVAKYGEPGAKLPQGLNQMKAYLELSDVKDHLVIYDPCFFSSKPLIAAMQREIYRILKEECPARGLDKEAQCAIEEIEINNPMFMDKCLKHALLLSYAGSHGEKASELSGQAKNIMGNKSSVKEKNSAPESSVVDGGYKRIAKKKKDMMRSVKKVRVSQIKLLDLLHQIGILKNLNIDSEGPKEEGAQVKGRYPSPVIDTHRHGVVHPIKLDNAFLVKFLPSWNQESLGKRAYDVNDVIDLFQITCPEYLSVAAVEFDRQGLWERLELQRCFALPGIYDLIFGDGGEMWIIEFIP